MIIFRKIIEQNRLDLYEKLPRELIDKGIESDIYYYIQDYLNVNDNILPPPSLVTIKYPSLFLMDSPLSAEVLLTEYLEERKKSSLYRELLEAADKVQQGDFVDYDRLKRLSSINHKTEEDAFNLVDIHDDMFERKGPKISFGVDIFDSITSSMRGGELAYAVGRPGSLKTTYLSYVSKVAWDNKQSVFLMSREINHADLSAKILGQLGWFNTRVLRDFANLSKKDRARYNLARERLRNGLGKIHLAPRSVFSVTDIKKHIDKLQPDLIAIDSAYMLSTSTGESGRDWQVLARISKELKDLAVDTNCPVMAVIQLKRNSKDILELDDIGYSDAFGQDADFVIGMQKGEEGYELQMMKNRYGQERIGILTHFDFTISRFRFGAIRDDNLSNL